MKRNSAKNIAGFLAVVAGLALLVLVPGMAVAPQEAPPPSTPPPIPFQVEKGSPKIEYALFKFQRAFQTEGLEKAKELAERYRMDLEEDRVRVVVEADLMMAGSGISALQALMSHISLLGGRIETSYEDLIQSRVPIAGLQELAANPMVRYIRLPLRPRPQGVTSEGVRLTGADLWHDLLPYRNSGAAPKVCILDVGFQNYSGLLGTELPSSVRTRSFRADGDLSAGEVHGTACAEIVYDMMPHADLYLVNFDTDVEQHQAVDWLISEGVEVISYSIGWWNAGDGKGTGPICRDVKKAADNGILWVGAAGNYARDHWEGTFQDGNGNGYHNFISSDEILQIYVPSWTPVGFFLNWDDWGTWNGSQYGGSHQDYEMELYYWAGSSWIFVDGSYNWQTGNAWPVEAIGYYYSNVSTYWGIAVYDWSTTRNCKLELFTYGNSSPCEYNVQEGSLIIPADSPDGIAVGATDAVADVLHSYSSRGPTHDGRIKPDFVAPSGVSVSPVTYGALGFYGTSASTPHMAGGLALVKGMTPYSWSQVRTILEERAVDMGALGKDNIYGIGRLNVKR